LVYLKATHIVIVYKKEEDGIVKIAGFTSSFTVSLALFVLSYFSLDEGYVWLLFGFGGFILAIIGAYIALSKRD
jgi:hypothetical protein